MEVTVLKLLKERLVRDLVKGLRKVEDCNICLRMSIQDGGKVV